MKPEEIIHKKHPKRLFILLLGVIVLFTLSSAVYLYQDIYRPLITHYSAVVTIVTDIHDTLIERTLKINALFFIMITAGILILGILYTHRVCGPLKRVQIFAKAVSEGKMGTRMSFREKDAIHSFGDTFNKMTEAHSDKIRKLTSEFNVLGDAVKEIKSLSEDEKDVMDGVERASEIDKRIKEVLNTLKV